MLYGFGFDAYLKGNWMHAKKFFEKALQYFPSDTPTLNLFDFIK